MKISAIKKAVYFFSFILGVLVLWVIGKYIGMQEIVQEFSKLHLSMLFPLTFFYSLAWMYRAKRLKQFGTMFNLRLSTKDAFFAEMLGNFANLIIPAKMGDALKVVYLKKKHTISYKRGTFISLLIRIMDLLAVLLLLLASALFVAGLLAGDIRSYFILGLAICGVCFLLFLSFLRFPAFYYSFLKGPFQKLQPLAERIREIFIHHRNLMSKIFLTSILVWIFDIFVLYLILVSFNIELGFARSTFILTAANLVKTFPVTPSAIGIFEGAMIALFGMFNVSKSTAFTISILDHGFKILYTLLGGFYILHRVNLSISKLIEKKQLMKTSRKPHENPSYRRGGVHRKPHG